MAGILTDGTSYEVYDVYTISPTNGTFGAPVGSGTYTDASPNISITMGTSSPPAAIGDVSDPGVPAFIRTPPSQDATFGAYVVYEV